MHDCQGDDVVHDAIRQQQVEAGVPLLTAAALAKYQGQHEEVLWAALFSLAVLIREGSNPYILSAEAAVQAGLLPLLQSAVKDYEVKAPCLAAVPQFCTNTLPVCYRYTFVLGLPCIIACTGITHSVLRTHGIGGMNQLLLILGCVALTTLAALCCCKLQCCVYSMFWSTIPPLDLIRCAVHGLCVLNHPADSVALVR